MRMLGSCDAENFRIELLEKNLAEFGITNMQTYIDSIVSDGASVMKMLGKNSQLDHQLCHTHGLHLRVLRHQKSHATTTATRCGQPAAISSQS